MPQLAATFSFMAGPLPAPEILQKYNEIIPGLADRLVTQAEVQAAHRHYLEKRTVDGNVFVQKTGPFLGAVVALAVMAFAYMLVLRGQSAEAIGVVIAEIVSLAGVFIYGKKKQREELEQSADAFARANRRIQG